MQAQQSLTLRGRSILGGGSDIGTNILPRKAANIMTKGVCRCMALEFSMMRDQKSLTLRWRSFLGGGSNIVTSIFAQKGGQ